MAAVARKALPQAILFACSFNAIRSPMALSIFTHFFGKAVYAQSAGVQPGELDPFAVAVMEEIGLDISKHRPHTFEDIEEWEGFNFDLVVTLSPQAHHRALELTRTIAVDVEYWPTPDPSGVAGNRQQKLDAYREVRDQLMDRIEKRFRQQGGGNE